MIDFLPDCRFAQLFCTALLSLKLHISHKFEQSFSADLKSRKTGQFDLHCKPRNQSETISVVIHIAKTRVFKPVNLLALLSADGCLMFTEINTQVLDCSHLEITSRHCALVVGHWFFANPLALFNVCYL